MKEVAIVHTIPDSFMVRPRQSVAVVVPMYRKQLNPEEQISFRHLVHFLGGYDKYLVIPENLHVVDYAGFGIKRFNSDFFASTASYSKLLLSRQFYEAFAEYEYILIYQLDCLVFSDKLIGWCEMGLDYIGAPFLQSLSHPLDGFSQVGNGGFSLRRIEGFLNVIDSFRRIVVVPAEYWQKLYLASSHFARYLAPLRTLRRKLRYLKSPSQNSILNRENRAFSVFGMGFNARWRMARYPLNEDGFWSYEARLFYPDFRIASVDVGLRFSFECPPRFCFEQNGYKIPFGCHAWYKYDRDFWEPYLLK